MRNWTVDTSKFDKKSPVYIKWKLEQLINFGLDDEKIKRNELKEYLSKLSIDPSKRQYLEYILHNA